MYSPALKISRQSGFLVLAIKGYWDVRWAGRYGCSIPRSSRRRN